MTHGTETPVPSHAPRFRLADAVDLQAVEGHRASLSEHRTTSSSARVFLKNREDPLPVGNRLIPEQPLLDLVELPADIRDKTLDGLTGAFLTSQGSKCGDRVDRPFDQPAAALQIR